MEEGLTNFNDIKQVVFTNPDQDFCLETKRNMVYQPPNDIKMQLLHGKLKFIKDWNNVVLAGGALSHYISEDIKNTNTFDYDLFLYGLDEIDAMAKVNYLIRSYEATFGAGLKFITPNAITINNTVQIILTLYKNKKDIIDHFDIDAGCIMFDGNDILVNDRGKHAFETGYVVIDPIYNTPSFQHRIFKYRSKNYGIIFKGSKDFINKEDNPSFKIKDYNVVSTAPTDIQNIYKGFIFKSNDLKEVVKSSENTFYNNYSFKSGERLNGFTLRQVLQDKVPPVYFKDLTPVFHLTNDIKLMFNNMFDRLKYVHHAAELSYTSLFKYIPTEDKNKIMEFYVTLNFDDFKSAIEAFYYEYIKKIDSFEFKLKFNEPSIYEIERGTSYEEFYNNS